MPFGIAQVLSTLRFLIESRFRFFKECTKLIKFLTFSYTFAYMRHQQHHTRACSTKLIQRLDKSTKHRTTSRYHTVLHIMLMRLCEKSESPLVNVNYLDFGAAFCYSRDACGNQVKIFVCFNELLLLLIEIHSIVLFISRMDCKHCKKCDNLSRFSVCFNETSFFSGIKC